MITVYTTNPCSQCRLTKRWLEARSIPHQVKDANESEETAAAIRAIAEADGVKPNMPYVVVSNGDPETDLHWFGFIPSNLEKYTTERKAA
ncbi:glutaredoxin domain-containing protein [Paenarthrobacter sp. GOM3]|uniref:glutaredoxin domain-containing protein n=1 Tax=Paenarthrobacter sp. GOM3 TaxID=2782567 RepID=UPI0027DC66B3|nr:glutaredoxin domain-containing protein [Paenarthrobacter sp. GOM3]WOH20747.1 glutaredoxin domain-containing protein [Paenarthrobacter sp. GOM3]